MKDCSPRPQSEPTAAFIVRTDQIACQWQVVRSFARRRKPQGKGRAALCNLSIRARLPGRVVMVRLDGECSEVAGRYRKRT